MDEEIARAENEGFAVEQDFAVDSRSKDRRAELRLKLDKTVGHEREAILEELRGIRAELFPQESA